MQEKGIIAGAMAAAVTHERRDCSESTVVDLIQSGKYYEIGGGVFLSIIA